jgi:hypothetical protein
MRIPYQSPEISDRIVDFDSDTLVRRPVKKSDLILMTEPLQRLLLGLLNFMDSFR